MLLRKQSCLFTLQSLAPSVTGDDLISVYSLILVTLANRPKTSLAFYVNSSPVLWSVHFSFFVPLLYLVS